MPRTLTKQPLFKLEVLHVHADGGSLVQVWAADSTIGGWRLAVRYASRQEGLGHIIKALAARLDGLDQQLWDLARDDPQICSIHMAQEVLVEEQATWCQDLQDLLDAEAAHEHD